MQALRTDGADIVVGNGAQALRVHAVPMQWTSPVSIDTEALEAIGDFQGEIAAARAAEFDEPSESETDDD